ncbi:MAG: dihydrolipoamide acetyltransferase family protein [Pseudomonadota bacterium]
MSTYTFNLPDLGEGTVESEIVEWYIKPGDTIQEDDSLVDVMTDKATIEITSPVNGVIVSLAGEPGDMIAVGAELVVFDTAVERLPSATQEEPVALPPPAEQPTTKPVTPITPAPVINDKPLASPATRHRAREAGVDLHAVSGTGPKGRITRQDLQLYIEGTPASCNEPLPKQVTPLPEPFVAAKQDDVETIKVIGLRRKIAEKMQTSKRHIPHFSYVEEVDVTELVALREHLNTNREAEQPKLSYLPFFMLTMAKVLDDFPQCNATYNDEQGVITRYSAKHIGVATQTDNGLMVPVVRHVESRDIWQCAHEIVRVAEAARSGKANKDTLSGSTITLSSLGILGGIASTPVINHPEVAIIGVNKTQERPVIQNGTVISRLMMNLSSSFDHRVVDGYDAAQMIQAMKSMLEHPATMFMS